MPRRPFWRNAAAPDPGLVRSAVMPLCVYAIVGRSSSRLALIRASGAGVASVRPVNARATAAMVSDCTGPVAPTAQALRDHDRMVRRIAKVAPAILPVRFGTLVESEPSLVRLLDAWSDDLQKALALVDRHCQMTLRLFVPTGSAPRPEGGGVPGEDAEKVEPAEAAQTATRPGTSYLMRRSREQAAAQSASELEPLREAFKKIVAAERIARHKQGPLILTAYHLIPRTAVTTYRRLLRRHAPALNGRAIVSGPWPPYAFVPELQR
jgi:hypothetical protein